jgi:hypothetical protein
MGFCRWAIVSALTLTLGAAPTFGYADGTVGKITQVTGKAQVKRGSSNIDAAAQMPVQLHDELVTGVPGELTLEMIDNSTLTLSESSVLAIDESLISGNVRSSANVGLLSGSVHALVSAVSRRAAPNFSVTTPNAIAGVRGTEFDCRYSAGKGRSAFPNCFEFTDCATSKGSVVVTNNPPRSGAAVTVPEGYRTTVACAAAPLAATPGTLGVLAGSTVVTSSTLLSPAVIVGGGLIAGGVIAGTTVGVIEATGGGKSSSHRTVTPRR